MKICLKSTDGIPPRCGWKSLQGMAPRMQKFDGYRVLFIGEQYFYGNIPVAAESVEAKCTHLTNTGHFNSLPKWCFRTIAPFEVGGAQIEECPPPKRYLGESADGGIAPTTVADYATCRIHFILGSGGLSFSKLYRAPMTAYLKYHPRPDGSNTPADCDVGREEDPKAIAECYEDWAARSREQADEYNKKAVSSAEAAAVHVEVIVPKPTKAPPPQNQVQFHIRAVPPPAARPGVCFGSGNYRC
jgi:hypothetical protein